MAFSIAMVVEASSGGTGTHVADLARQLLDRGFVVHVLYGTARADRRFTCALEELRSHPGFYPYPLPIRHHLSWTDIGAIWALIRYFWTHRPVDVVHAHSTKAGLVARIAAAVCGIPSIYTPHGILSGDPTAGKAKRRLAALLERTLGRISSRVIAVSDAERAQLLHIGVPARRVEFIPNGIDLSSFRPPKGARAWVRARLGVPDEHVCVGFVGRLVPQKNPELIVDAFAAVAKRLPACRLIVVGSGPLEQSLKRRVQGLGAAGAVIWCGETDARQIFPAFDLFAISSRTESWPYAVMEAMAHGLPVVATNVGGMPALVQSGCNGFLVPSGDSDAFGTALFDVMANPALRGTMGDASRTAAGGFSLESMAARVEEVYLESRPVLRGLLEQAPRRI